MGYSSKYGYVTTEFGNIPHDEPVMVFRGQDIILSGLLVEYIARLVSSGADIKIIKHVWHDRRAINEWQAANLHMVKVPD